MPNHEVSNLGRDKPAVYTIGLAHLKTEDLQRVVSDCHIKHVFDIRGSKQFRGPETLKPTDLAKLVDKFNSQYHDETKVLGDRKDYALFTITDEFSQAVKFIAESSNGDNILLICKETDYRRCHRRVVATYLALKGFDVRHLGRGLSISFQSTLETNMLQHPRARRMFTIGFTKKTMREFAALLRDARIKRLVDIRLRPVSQYSGFARKEDLEFLLELMGIEYVHATELAPTAALLDGYRLNFDWSGYEREFNALLRERKPDALLLRLLPPGMNVAFLCTEDFPDRCHRRLVAEYAARIIPKLEIVHLTSEGSYAANSLHQTEVLVERE